MNTLIDIYYLNWFKVIMSDYEAEVEDCEQEDSRRRRKGYDSDAMLGLDSAGVRRSFRSRKPPPPKQVHGIKLFVVNDLHLAVFFKWC